jgi:hypothetical protein
MYFVSAVIEWDGTGWIKGNTNYKGFYITNYEDSNWEALARQLTDNHTVRKDRILKCPLYAFKYI